MKLHATIADYQTDVQIRDEGPHVSAEIDGRRYDLEVHELAASGYLLIHNSQVFECRVEGRPESGKSVEVIVGTTQYAVTLTDPKRLRGASGMAAHADEAARIIAPMPGKVVRVLVEVGAGKESTVADDEFKQLVKDITLQIAAGHPSAVSRDQVPAVVVAKEKEIAAEQVKNKPAQAIAKIVDGKLEKFYQTHCLVDQGFVKKNSEISVKEHLGSVAKQLGDEITIRRFVRFQVGESGSSLLLVE